MSINLVSFWSPLFLFFPFTNSYSLLAYLFSGAGTGTVFMAATHQDVLPLVIEEVHSFHLTSSTSESTAEIISIPYIEEVDYQRVDQFGKFLLFLLHSLFFN